MTARVHIALVILALVALGLMTSAAFVRPHALPERNFYD